jgi:hypothetical protein
MLVRRGAVRLATVCTLLAGLVLVGAAPALAADEVTVKLGLPSSFTAGGSAGSITVTMAKRSKGCVSVRTLLAFQLPGLSANDVGLLVAQNGNWQPVPVADGGDGLVTTGQVVPEKPTLCERKSVSVRYRLGFAAGTPDGKVTIVAEAYTTGGDLLQRAAETRRVNGARPTPTPTPTPTRTSATPTPQATETTVAPEPESTEVGVVAPTGQPGLVAGKGSGGGGIGSMVMVLGVGMVAIGIALLLVLLLRRARGGRDEPGAGGAPGAGPPSPFPPSPFPPSPFPPPAGAGGDATVMLPRIRP